MTLLILSSGLSSARTDSTPDSSITRCDVTAQRSLRHSSQRQNAHAADTVSATPAAGSAYGLLTNNAPIRHPARNSVRANGPPSTITWRRATAASCSSGLRRVLMPTRPLPGRRTPRRDTGPSRPLLENLGTAHHLKDLLGDGCLADLVHLQREGIDHLAGVPCRV